MVKKWLVSLEVARDDDGPLSDVGMTQLASLLTKGGTGPVLSQSDSGTVLVSITVDGRSDFEARSAAERALRCAANTVWSDLGLPPFTIAFIDAVPTAGG